MRESLLKSPFMKKLLTPTKHKRILFFLFSDLFFFLFSIYIAAILRFEFSPPAWVLSNIIIWYPLMSAVKILFMMFFRVYSFNWSFVGINEFYSIFRAVFLACILLLAIDIFMQKSANDLSIPKSLILIDALISSILIMSLRILKRVYREILFNDASNGTRTIIIGAGATGERIARELLRNKNLGLRPAAFLDDNPHKKGTYLQGVKVIGNNSDIKEAVIKTRASVAIIAIAQASHTLIKNLYKELKECDINNIKIVPSISDMPNQLFNIRDLRDINLEDLMSRREITIEEDAVSNFINGKKVLVSGAAGSIGSEIVRQLIKYGPQTIYTLEIDETELHDLILELNRSASDTPTIIPYLCDIRNKEKVNRIFEESKPDLVFHAAAYKHVPLIESFPDEAVTTNIFGTQNLVKAASEYKVKAFVNISTDKAVNPTSLMGATKKMAEHICLNENKNSETNYVSVRFGNVLGSRGSVLTIFQNQIKTGGPITITHPDMERYFMSIPEAVLLVFQAASMSSDSGIFILDMGEPKKILEIAEELIKLNGFTPYSDIDIKYTGLRPGEKLYEELLCNTESVANTYHNKIFQAQDIDAVENEKLMNTLEQLKNASMNVELEEIKDILKSYVPFCK